MSADKFDSRSSTTGEPCSQVGAVCWRKKNGRIEILLITSRGTGRWVIPKGWPMDGKTASEAAAREAYEEAGVQGETATGSIGLFTYNKCRDDGRNLPCVVSVFAVEVRRRLDSFPEKGQRRRRWFSRRKAAEAVDEPELKQILRGFDPKSLR